LTGEPETGSDAGHDGGDEVVEITVGGCIKLEGSDADVVQSLVVNAEGFIRVFNELLYASMIPKIKKST